jgi:lipid II:glycine glycyltransferase (peptidoglycan interpeptide bridge formation enzyme)
MKLITNLKRKLKKLCAKNFTVSFSPVMPAQFNEMYNVTMDRQNANVYYYFGLDYFKKLAQIDGVFQTNVFDMDTSIIICSGIFFEQGEYHLGATKDEYMSLSPSSLMIYETAKYFQSNLPAKKLNLGGGNEKLLQFKKGFSKSVQYFSSHKWVINQDQYTLLNTLRNAKNASPTTVFPEYRN